ncbi:MAG: hypothetical protein ACI33S_04145 [Bacilli bacterium]
MNDFDYKVHIVSPIKNADINFLNEISRQYPNSKILVEVNNTRGLSSTLAKALKDNIYFRVAGGYTKERVKIYKDVTFRDGSKADYFYDSVIYSRNELINILREIEKIENGINSSWTDLQKVIYIYTILEGEIMYDPKYEIQPSSEIRTLRGLLSKKTVCAGYAMIFKELLDRQKIECEYVEGVINKDINSNVKHRGHAWNIITLNGRKYGVDLTHENSNYRRGSFHTFNYLGTNKESFCQSHYPYYFEETQNYEDTLSELDINLINKFYNLILIDKEYKKTLYTIKRKDGSLCTICHIGSIVSDDNKVYHRYFYLDGLPGTNKQPSILYSDFNMTEFIYSKLHGKGQEYTHNMQYAIANRLFSNKNINDSKNRQTSYIGNPFDKNNNEVENIEKDQKSMDDVYYPTKVFIREDGSVFILEHTYNVDTIYGMMYSYNVYELINNSGEYILKTSTVCSENNLIEDNRNCIPNILLSREHINESCEYYHGYIGYCNKNGNVLLNKDIFNILEQSAEDIFRMEKYSFRIPSYSELKHNLLDYDVNFKNRRVINKYTKNEITDKRKLKDIAFSRFWAQALDVISVYNSSYIFSEEIENFYTNLFTSISISIEENGYIDTKRILEDMVSTKFIFAPMIVVNLFSSVDKVNYIYEYLTGNKPKKEHEALYNLDYASRLIGIFNNTNRRK